MDKNKQIENLINVVYGDITTFNGDCIVNAANSSLLGGGGVDGAIHRAAGIELFNECKKLGGCKTGEAKITKGYNLPAKYVIHTVGCIYSGSAEDGMLLSNCYINSLNLAKRHNIFTIAFPAISTGIYGYPLEEATEIAVNTVKNWLKNNDYKICVCFYCYDEKTFKEYVKQVKNS